MLVERTGQETWGEDYRAIWSLRVLLCRSFEAVWGGNENISDITMRASRSDQFANKQPIKKLMLERETPEFVSCNTIQGQVRDHCSLAL